MVDLDCHTSNNCRQIAMKVWCVASLPAYFHSLWLFKLLLAANTAYPTWENDCIFNWLSHYRKTNRHQQYFYTLHWNICPLRNHNTALRLFTRFSYSNQSHATITSKNALMTGNSVNRPAHAHSILSCLPGAPQKTHFFTFDLTLKMPWGISYRRIWWTKFSISLRACCS